jgi:hypothetical protein
MTTVDEAIEQCVAKLLPPGGQAVSIRGRSARSQGLMPYAMESRGIRLLLYDTKQGARQ